MADEHVDGSFAHISPRILIAGMGNLLRRDDGFGVEVARRLLALHDLPSHVSVIEVGIGGLSLVQELMAWPRYEMLIVVDAVQHQGAPGQIYLFEADIPSLAALPESVRQVFLADAHYATPERALVLSKALDVLPSRTMILGCQPAEVDELGIGLSEPVAAAVEPAIARICSICHRMAYDEAPTPKREISNEKRGS